jgi:hypothetical protein
MMSNYEKAEGLLARYADVAAEMSGADAVGKSIGLAVAMQNAQVYALLAVADALRDAKAPE